MSGTAAFCQKCGTKLPDGATFCPRCGFAVAGTAGPAPPAGQAAAPQPPMDVYMREKAEKREKHEKREKREKREKNEKGGEGGVLGALVGGALLIWLGATFFLEQNGYVAGDVWWAYFLAGVGAILILQGVFLYARGRTGLGSVIGGFFALFIGLSSVAARAYSFSDKLWPLLIVVLGVLVLVAGFATRRRVMRP